MNAFIQRDLGTLEETMHPDIVMHVPGGSWLAGTYRGPEQVSRCILGLRQLLRSSPGNAPYLHDGDHMIVTHRIELLGPLHESEMTFGVAITFDADERVRAVLVEPSDLAPTLASVGPRHAADTRPCGSAIAHVPRGRAGGLISERSGVGPG